MPTSEIGVDLIGPFGREPFEHLSDLWHGAVRRSWCSVWYSVGTSFASSMSTINWKTVHCTPDYNSLLTATQLLCTANQRPHTMLRLVPDSYLCLIKSNILFTLHSRVLENNRMAVNDYLWVVRCLQPLIAHRPVHQCRGCNHVSFWIWKVGLIRFRCVCPISLDVSKGTNKR